MKQCSSRNTPYQQFLTAHHLVQFKMPDSNAQNLESQQRSRARGKALIDDLSREIEEYKHRGAEATREMRNAARAIAIENRRLRALLGLYGVSEGEISRYLSRAASGIPEIRRGRIEYTTYRVNPAEYMAAGRRRIPEMSQTSPIMSTRSSSTITSSADEIQRHRSSDEASYYQRPRDDYRQGLKYLEGETSANILPSMSNGFGPPVPSTTDAGRTGALETPCDTAAAILAGLHDQTDAAPARSALGCADTSSCPVRTTANFGLKDILN